MMQPESVADTLFTFGLESVIGVCDANAARVQHHGRHQTTYRADRPRARWLPDLPSGGQPAAVLRARGLQRARTRADIQPARRPGGVRAAGDISAACLQGRLQLLSEPRRSS